MSTKLENVIESLRALPVSKQNDLAELIMSLTGMQPKTYALNDEERKAVEIGLQQAERGEFVGDDAMAAFWSRPKTT